MSPTLFSRRRGAALPALRPITALILGALIASSASAQAPAPSSSAASQPAQAQEPASTPATPATPAAATSAPAAAPTAAASGTNTATGTAGSTSSSTSSTTSATASATPPEKKPEEAPGTTAVGEMQTVSVVAERPTSLIDRNVYEVKSDATTTNASATDILANVPSVTVDPDGKVAVRGNQNTQIFVNGKRSAMFSGANGGDALNSFPADALETVEVITTPGAEFGSEGGSGPILNLVLRRSRPPGGRATVSVNGGKDGRYNSSVNGSYNSGLFQLDGQVGIRHDGRNSVGESETFTQVGNSTWNSVRTSSSRGLTDAITLNPNMSYNVGKTDRATFNLSYQRSKSDTDNFDHYINYRGGATPYEDYVRNYRSERTQTVYQVALGYENKFAEGHEIKYDLRSSRNANDRNSRYVNVYTITPPSGPRVQSADSQGNSQRVTDLSIDYKGRITPMLSMAAGVKIGQTTGASDRDYFNIDPVTGEEIDDPNRSSAFESDDRSYAVYGSATYLLTEHWRVMPGLRLERLARHTHYLAQNADVRDVTTKALPSLHVRYDPRNDWGAVDLSFSKRVGRPSLDELNPNLQYQNETSFSQGDPRLTPTKSEKFEIKYSDDFFSVLNAYVNLFREKDSPLLGRFLTPVPGTSAVLTQSANYGKRVRDGLVFNFMYRPSRTLNMGATVSFTMMEQSYLQTQTNSSGQRFTAEGLRKINSRQLQLRAQYSGIENHTLQLNGTYQGRSLWGISINDPSWHTSLTWRWRITPRLSSLVSLTDMFDSNEQRTYTESELVRSNTLRNPEGRVFYVGLSYNFGGVTGDARIRGGGMRGPGMNGGGMRGGPGGGGGGGFGGGGGGGGF